MPKTRKEAISTFFTFFITVFFFFIHKICSEKVTFHKKLTALAPFPLSSRNFWGVRPTPKFECSAAALPLGVRWRRRWASCIAFEVVVVFSLTLRIFAAVSRMAHIRRTRGSLHPAPLGVAPCTEALSVHPATPPEWFGSLAQEWSRIVEQAVLLAEHRET